jgi:Kef-type K+ transport system membrane component KefB
METLGQQLGAVLPLAPLAEAAPATSAVGAAAETLVLQLLYQLIAILVVTRIVVAGARYLGQTPVAGEILAGLVLGPSVLGALFPDAMHQLFAPATATIFTALAQLGLVLLMFQIGLEFEFMTHLAPGKKAIGLVSALGILTPFTLGYWTGPWFLAQLPPPHPETEAFRLFFATALSITAIPILGRIFLELDLAHTRTAALTIGAAAIDDVVGWLLLGVVAAVVQAQFVPATLVSRLVGLLGYLALVFLIVRPWLHRAIDAHLARYSALQPSAIALLLILLFVSAAITSSLGVFAIFGGFVVGVALHEDRRFVVEWKARVAPLVSTFFLLLNEN